MIKKQLECVLSQEEISSPEDIEIILSIKIEGEEGQIDYTINYPKALPSLLPSIEDIKCFLQTDEECQKILNK
jgi:hypothetical protein